ncbi:MAG: PAS domain S-box protein [Dehalococcoidia bacterium]|nr:PAS domain S-box protein [Dehalococcoidia bacterium]
MPETPTSTTLLTDAQLGLLVGSIQDYAIFLLDNDGYVMSWNPGAARIKGYSEQDIVGKHFSVFYPDGDQLDGKPARLLGIATREGRVEDEGWRVRKDGSRFWANVVITALNLPDGTAAGYAKITRDLTEHRLAEQALHESEQRFRLLVDAVRDYAIFMLSPDGFIISWNSGARRMNGYTAEEIIGRHFSAFYSPEEVAGGKPELELEIALADGRYEEEGWRIRKDGTRFWANVVISPIRDQDGRLLGFSKVTRDQTERRRAREELVASQQRQRELTLENVAKDEFLALVAHELRTPVSVLYGGTRLLVRHDDALGTKDREDLLRNLATESERLKGLIESLLLLVNPNPNLELAPARLRELVARAVGEFRRDSPNRRVDLHMPPDEIVVEVEQSLLCQVVLNLLSNADKYSPRSTPIDVFVSRESTSVVVEVMDRGLGVDPAELHLIFTTFYRTARAIDSAPGKGLGLAICKRLVELMNGAIEARARDGGGLIVRFTLPILGS